MLPAREHLEQGLALYALPEHQALAFHYGIDPGVLCGVYIAETLWLLGYPAQAVQHIHQAVTLAQDLAHPFTLVYAWTSAAVIHHCRREASQAHGWTAQAIALSRDQGFPLRLAQAMILQGWAQTAQGQGEEHIAHMQQGLTMFRETGATLNLPYWLLQLAEAQEMAGHIGEGLQAASQALGLADHSGERYYEAELYRLQGALLLHQSPDASPEAESCFHQALSIARHQHAKSLELRAATSLARLWQQQGKRQDAYDLLAPVYGWFTEGFDTADLQDAKALLEALRAPRSASAGSSS